MSHGLTLGQDVLDRLMPMHLCVAECGLIRSAGPTMRKLMPPDAQDVEDVFVEGRGAASGRVIGAIRAAKGGNRLALRLRHHRRLSLRGHVVAPGFGGLLLNFCFGVSLSEAVAVFGLTESDFAPSELALELMFLQEANRAVQQELARFNRHLMLARKDAEREAHTDALTGLLNRRGLQVAMQNAFEPQHGTPGFALAHLDLDNFKQVNDRMGHAAGDRLLVEVARVLTRTVRPRDGVARIGGDEFVLILDGAWTCQALTDIGTRIIQGIEDVSPADCNVSTSIGIVLSAGYSADAIDRMLEDADVALYRSKREGKGRVSIAPLPVAASPSSLQGLR